MSRAKKIFLFLVLTILVVSGIIFLKGVKSFSIISKGGALFFPKRDERWDILILGMRGRYAKSGGMLTDSIIVLSYKKETGETAIISIPRDLWVEVPNWGMQRINYAYVAGETEEKGGGGLRKAKEVIKDVTALDIDFAVVVDTSALKEIVDTLGGIEIYEDRYFSMQFYKNYVTIYPGKNYLSGSEAMAYTGSRAVGSDFGRMKRQQKVILAMKDKVFSLGLLARPDKIWNILDSVERHVEADIPFSQLKELIQIASSLKIESIKQVVFDTTNYLYSTHTSRGAYILLPKAGDFSEIKELCQNIFEQPVSKDMESVE